MRKIGVLYLVVASLFAMPVFADDCTTETNAAGQVTKKTCGSAVTTYSYTTSSGNNVVTAQTKENGKLVDYNKTTYYGDSTNVKETVQRGYEDGKQSKELTTKYAENGTKTSYTEENKAGSNNTTGKTTTTWDANTGALKSTSVSNYEYNEEKKKYYATDVVTKDYNANGTIKKETVDTYDTGTHLSIGTTTYSYDENGRVAGSETVLKTPDENGRFTVVSNTSSSTYEYNESGSYQVYTNGVLVGRFNKSGTPIEKKKIYTVKEAEAVSKKTGNRIMLRYK